ncbi:STAS domain-containing protein [Luteimicrobium album]|uniref:STAS domain-containing protein n=1 Tax=Luteimicrobium album TaxID=1054550 RepID=UPI0024E0AE59|nr:STAS domain-containing protein [Luteimicrobium album]
MATGTIALVEEQDRTVVVLTGEIDVALRAEASAALANALERDLPVVIDASEVTFADSTGIAFLVQFVTIGHDEGLDVMLLDPPQIIVEVLDMLGVRELLVRPAAAEPAVAASGAA